MAPENGFHRKKQCTKNRALSYAQSAKKYLILFLKNTTPKPTQRAPFDRERNPGYLSEHLPILKTIFRFPN